MRATANFAQRSARIMRATANLAQRSARFSRHYHKSILTVLLLTLSSSPHAQADPKKSPAALPAEYTVEHLTNDVELPDLPAYPNNKRKLISALSFPNVSGGPCYVFRYGANEDSKQILDWYCAALKNYNWKIERADRSVVIATNKTGSWCNVIVQTAKNGERTRFEVQYRVSGKVN